MDKIGRNPRGKIDIPWIREKIENISLKVFVFIKKLEFQINYRNRLLMSACFSHACTSLIHVVHESKNMRSQASAYNNSNFLNLFWVFQINVFQWSWFYLTSKVFRKFGFSMITPWCYYRKSIIFSEPHCFLTEPIELRTKTLKNARKNWFLHKKIFPKKTGLKNAQKKIFR